MTLRLTTPLPPTHPLAPSLLALGPDFPFVSFSTASRSISGMRITHEINSVNSRLPADRLISILSVVFVIVYERSWTNFVIYCYTNPLVARDRISAPSLDCNWTPTFRSFILMFCHGIKVHQRLSCTWGIKSKLVMTFVTLLHCKCRTRQRIDDF